MSNPNQIQSLLNSPEQLERLYREDRELFRKQFDEIYPQIQNEIVAKVWHERLHFTSAQTDKRNSEIGLMLFMSLVAGVMVKLPDITGIEKSFYFMRNIGLVFFPMLIWYFARKNINGKKIQIVIGILVLLYSYINFLPGNSASDTLVLACIHIVLFTWSILGYTYVGFSLKDLNARLDFLRYNGELLIMSALIVITGGILTGITIGLFHLIGMDIESFYRDNIAICGLAATPIVGTWMIINNPQLVKHVAPMIARVFTPLVILTLSVYLVAVMFSDKNPFHDRDYLMLFNGVLVGVMALIFFSLSEKQTHTGKYNGVVLVMLSVITILLNGIVLSAIIFRINEWGFTPNRLSVLGGNVLILINLILVSKHLISALFDQSASEKAGLTIAHYLPVYTLWTLLVVLLFPVMFRFI